MATYNDGAIPYGIPVTVTIGGEVYVVEDFSGDLASTVIERRNGLGVLTGRVVIDDQPAANSGWTGTLTLQRADVTVPIPNVGAQVEFSDGGTWMNDLGFPTDDGTRVRVISSSGSQSQTTAHTFTVRITGEINL